jgi:hypothetical protein
MRENTNILWKYIGNDRNFHVQLEMSSKTWFFRLPEACLWQQTGSDVVQPTQTMILLMCNEWR